MVCVDCRRTLMFGHCSPGAGNYLQLIQPNERHTLAVHIPKREAKRVWNN